MKTRSFSIIFLCLVFCSFGWRTLFAAAVEPKEVVDTPFEYIFDGVSFKGWEGDLEAWRVNPQERSLQNFAKGTIYTKKKYDNFILQFEFQVLEGGNNGALIRLNEQMRRWEVKPIEIQFGDDRHWHEDYTGCVFGLLSGPRSNIMIGKKTHNGGAWNFLEIIAIDDHIITYVNGTKVVDRKLPRHYSPESFPDGNIGFLGWTGESAIRFIRLKPISKDYDWKTSKMEDERGFKRLFNGKSFRGWRGDFNKWNIKSGILTSHEQGKLFTEKQYSDFILRFDFRLSKGSNNGVCFRYAPTRTPSGYKIFGPEIQILDDWNHPDISAVQAHGSLFRVVPTRKHSLKKIGEWNTQEIFAQGSRLKVTVNDQVVVDTDIKEIELPNVPGLHNAAGRLFFDAHQESTEFKNIRIKEL